MSKPDLSNRLPLRDDVKLVAYHRPPTPYEIKIGEGATHYAEFAPKHCCHKGTRIPKRWFIYPFDGLRYYR